MRLLVFCILAAAFMAALPAGVLGFSIGSPPNDVVDIPEGKSAAYGISIQHIDGYDLQVMVSVDSQQNIASIVNPKELYIIPAQSGIGITFNITLPEGAKLGDVFDVAYTVSPAKASTGGSIPINVGIRKQFKVKVVKDPEKFYFGSYLRDNGMLLLVLLVTVAAYLWYRHHERKKGRKK